MPSDKAAQLLRALFVHSVGFFEHINELVFHVKNKKEVIMNVWRVFHMLLESCQKVDHKLIMIELAEQFEVERQQFRDSEQETARLTEQKLTALKNELKDREEHILKLKDQIIRSEEEYSRLNQTYQILAGQNEEALTLRLRTEARLKDLFSRERMREQELIALRKHREEIDA